MWLGELFLRNLLPYPPNIPGFKGGNILSIMHSNICDIHRPGSEMPSPQTVHDLGTLAKDVAIVKPTRTASPLAQKMRKLQKNLGKSYQTQYTIKMIIII